jgi:hypothetical protein
MSDKDPRVHYIIDLKTPTTELSKGNNPGRKVTFRNLADNPDYGAMKSMTAQEHMKFQGESGVPLALRGRPENFHNVEHMEGTIRYETDEDGLLWIPKDQIEDAKSCMKTLRGLDPDVKFSNFGLKLTDEELLAPPAKPAVKATPAK